MLDAFRADFPALSRGVYANVASRGIISRTTKAAIDRIVEESLDGTGSKEGWSPVLAEARAGFARLIKAEPAEIAFTKNVSEGLNSVAAAFDWRAGDNVVLCPALEHPNNIYVWANLKRHGVELRLVPARDGLELDAEAMVAAIDARTRVVTASTVTFTPGFRTDLGAIGRAARAAGAFFLVDAVQSAGILALDVGREQIDGLATSSSKGLLGLIGAGFLYVRAAWAERLEPVYAARFSVDSAGRHESELGDIDFRWLPDARRFEIGNYNWAGISALAASMKQLEAIGAATVEAHALGLARGLADGLAGLGLPVCRPRDARAATHIVTVGRLGAGGAYATEDARLNRIAKALEAGGVRFSIRRGQLRFGFHAYNNAEDVGRILSIAKETA